MAKRNSDTFHVVIGMGNKVPFRLRLTVILKLTKVAERWLTQRGVISSVEWYGTQQEYPRVMLPGIPVCLQWMCRPGCRLQERNCGCFLSMKTLFSGLHFAEEILFFLIFLYVDIYLFSLFFYQHTFTLTITLPQSNSCLWAWPMSRAREVADFYTTCLIYEYSSSLWIS